VLSGHSGLMILPLECLTEFLSHFFVTRFGHGELPR
jgi:hypothetical protein